MKLLASPQFLALLRHVLWRPLADAEAHPLGTRVEPRNGFAQRQCLVMVEPEH
ncbi:MAG: hypothetical protein ACOY3L_04215 [Pseudomonadota bacterium]